MEYLKQMYSIAFELQAFQQSYLREGLVYFSNLFTQVTANFLLQLLPVLSFAFELTE